MIRSILISTVVLFFLVSCQDDDVNVFEKTADQRAAEAVQNLRNELTSPGNGWRVRYKPVQEGGSFYLILRFNEDNTVNIQSDLGSNDGEFFNQTITYRIDNSLGLELIFESYSFFSFLFEQNQATFGAEFEFNYVNKTPDGALVFSSKSDISTPSTMVLEPANSADVNLLGRSLATDLNAISDDLQKFSSSLSMTFENKDLTLYLSIDDFSRTLTITSGARKSNSSITQIVDFTSGYYLRGDSLVLERRFSGNVVSSGVVMKGIRLNESSESALTICENPIPIQTFNGTTSAGDRVSLQTSIVDVSGATFATSSDYYYTPLQYILKDGQSVNTITTDVAGAVQFDMYYGLQLNDGSLLYGIGFVIENPNGTYTFALKEFTPTVSENRVTFEFEDGFRLFGEQQTSANLDNINIYLNALTEGNNTYAFKIADGIFEFHNPCSGWTFVLFDGNQ